MHALHHVGPNRQQNRRANLTGPLPPRSFASSLCYCSIKLALLPTKNQKQNTKSNPNQPTNNKNETKGRTWTTETSRNENASKSKPCPGVLRDGPQAWRSQDPQPSPTASMPLPPRHWVSALPSLAQGGSQGAASLSLNISLGSHCDARDPQVCPQDPQQPSTLGLS